MKTIISLLALVSVMAHASPSSYYYTGNELHHQLGDSSSYFNRGAGSGFIVGVHDSNSGTFHCTPKEVKIGQIVDVVKQGLNNAPEHRHLPAHVLVNMILMKAWPCPTK